MAFEQPDLVRKELIKGVSDLLPEGYDVDRHFSPRYRPWQQRIAFVPEGDLFAGIKAGKASMVTDEIDTFTETGIRTRSGQELEADVIVTATGFDLSVLGDIPFTVDGTRLDLADTVTWRGMMFTGVPNLLWIFGYFRASWTLRVDLAADRGPPPAPHGGQGHPDRDPPAPARGGCGHGAARLGRPRGLQPRLSDALHAPHAQAGRQAALSVTELTASRVRTLILEVP